VIAADIPISPRIVYDLDRDFGSPPRRTASLRSSQ